MTQEKCKAIFELADITVKNIWELPNGYFGKPNVPDKKASNYDILNFINESSVFFIRPWWLVKTPMGLIRIGWRKRVIEIDWSDTELEHIVTEDDVTKGPYFVHAYNETKAAQYLENLRMHYETTL